MGVSRNLRETCVPDRMETRNYGAAAETTYYELVCYCRAGVRFLGLNSNSYGLTGYVSDSVVYLTRLRLANTGPT